MTAAIAEAARHYAARDLRQAARVCLDIIAADPRHFDALHLLGVICTNRGQFADGVSYLLRAEALRPPNARLQANLGSAYGAMQLFDKSVEAYRRAVALGHRDAGAHTNLGLALLGLEQNDAAVAAFRDAIALDPTSDLAVYNLGRAHAAANRHAQAEAEFRKLFDRMPPDAPAERAADVTNSLARAVIEQGRPEESLAVLRAKQCDAASVRWHEALVLLLLGRYAEGWAAYESRYDAPGHDRPHPRSRVLDLGQVAGQRVLVKEEQGRGDVIQCLRYLRPLAERGARVRLCVYPDLLPLARELAHVEHAVEPADDVPDHDLVTSVMSLPLAFSTVIETIPAEMPYLRAPASRIARVAHHLGRATGPRIGLVWAGSAASRARSAMPLAVLRPLTQRAGPEFHCLQKEIAAADLAVLEQIGRIATHTAMLRDFGDTAALIEAMDLVITIDTAVAHLAGALAKPVWIMLPFNPDWRWLSHRADSPWYPSARLFRQTQPGDWESVAQSVATALGRSTL